MARRLDTGPGFPQIPPRWNEESRMFALGLRNIIEQMWARAWQRAYPVGAVVLSVNAEKPFSFGKWEAIATGITGVNGWKRVE